MQVDVLLGLQWGDEGKGKIVDALAPHYQIVARFQGGPNAGHTLVIDGVKYVLHTIPSGIFRQGIINLIGNGVVVDPVILKKELGQLDAAGIPYKDNLLLSRKAHLILPTHRYLDAASEASKGTSKIGSTLKGIGPTYMDKTGRNGLRIGDIQLAGFDANYQTLKRKHLHLISLFPDIDFNLQEEEDRWMESLDILRGLHQIDAEYYLHDALLAGKRVLAEGAQGSLLDVDFGTYPYVTSSNTITAGVCTGLGLAPQKVGEVIGITKAYCTRVGSGPFPTELHDETGDFLRKAGHEFGSTTGRPRRCGWIDLPLLKYTIMLNGVTQLAVTKIDVLNAMADIKAATAYIYDGKRHNNIPFDLNQTAVAPEYHAFAGWEEDLLQCETYDSLPVACKSFLTYLEEYLHVKVTMVSTGPERESLIER
ncbi:MAG: adenylosuccinate synthase [Saprospiraceae bacterium]|nr:adenylosuccinate synthase [Saprospiraceae bacterium]